MKVLLIDVNCKNSSTGQIVYNLYSYLNSQGNEAAVCYGRGELIDEKNIYKFGLDWETYLHALLTRITGYTGCFSFFSTKRLIKFIDSFKPDIVHIHELHAYFLNIKTLLHFLAKKNIKVVHTLHCEFSYTGKCGHSIECEKWKTECNHCPHIRNYPKSIIFDHTKHMFNVKRKEFLSLNNPIFVAPSKWLKKRIEQSFLGKKDIRLIHNGIDTTIFRPKEIESIKLKNNLLKSKYIVLAVAPDLMSENKGGNYIVDLANKMIDYNVIFILIGTNEKYQNNNVLSLGKIYDKELLADYYSMANLFVICSKNENFPTTCIEAICCNTPIVGFDVGGVKEIVPDSLGTFVEYGNVEQLKEIIIRYMNGEIKVSSQQFEELHNYYSLDRFLGDYLKIYNECI